MQGQYAVFIRSKDGTLTERLNEFASLDILMTLNDPGSWNIRSTSAEKCPFSAGDGIVVVRNGVFLYGGVMTQLSDDYDAHMRLHTWQAQGKGDLEYLGRRICYIDPETGRTDQATHYTATGSLGTVIHDLIRLNAGSDAMAERVEPIIEDNTQNVGPTVSVSLRLPNLLKTVTALVSGNGWNIRPNWDEENSKVFYQVFQGRDLTEQIVFSEQFSNLLSSEHLETQPAGNFILAGGTGQGTERSFDTAQSDESISEWGRIEVFQDARNQPDVETYVEEVLADKTADTVGYSCTASDDDLTPQFGTDFVLGDFVGMMVFGQFITAEVQQCEISLSEGVETITPRFGTVAIGKLRSIFQQLADLRGDIDELLGSEVE